MSIGRIFLKIRRLLGYRDVYYFEGRPCLDCQRPMLWGQALDLEVGKHVSCDPMIHTDDKPRTTWGPLLQIPVRVVNPEAVAKARQEV